MNEINDYTVFITCYVCHLIKVSQPYPHNITIPTYIITEKLRDGYTRVLGFVAAESTWQAALHRPVLQIHAISRGLNILRIPFTGAHVMQVLSSSTSLSSCDKFFLPGKTSNTPSRCKMRQKSLLWPNTEASLFSTLHV